MQQIALSSVISTRRGTCRRGGKLAAVLCTVPPKGCTTCQISELRTQLTSLNVQWHSLDQTEGPRSCARGSFAAVPQVPALNWCTHAPLHLVALCIQYWQTKEGQRGGDSNGAAVSSTRRPRQWKSGQQNGRADAGAGADGGECGRRAGAPRSPRATEILSRLSLQHRERTCRPQPGKVPLSCSSTPHCGSRYDGVKSCGKRRAALASEARSPTASARVVHYSSLLAACSPARHVQN